MRGSATSFIHNVEDAELTEHEGGLTLKWISRFDYSSFKSDVKIVSQFENMTSVMKVREACLMSWLNTLHISYQILYLDLQPEIKGKYFKSGENIPQLWIRDQFYDGYEKFQDWVNSGTIDKQMQSFQEQKNQQNIEEIVKYNNFLEFIIKNEKFIGGKNILKLELKEEGAFQFSWDTNFDKIGLAEENIDWILVMDSSPLYYGPHKRLQANCGFDSLQHKILLYATEKGSERILESNTQLIDEINFSISLNNDLKSILKVKANFEYTFLFWNQNSSSSSSTQKIDSNIFWELHMNDETIYLGNEMEYFIPELPTGSYLFSLYKVTNVQKPDESKIKMGELMVSIPTKNIEVLEKLKICQNVSNIIAKNFPQKSLSSDENKTKINSTPIVKPEGRNRLISSSRLRGLSTFVKDEYDGKNPIKGYNEDDILSDQLAEEEQLKELQAILEQEKQEKAMMEKELGVIVSEDMTLHERNLQLGRRIHELWKKKQEDHEKIENLRQESEILQERNKKFKEINSKTDLTENKDEEIKKLHSQINKLTKILESISLGLDLKNDSQRPEIHNAIFKLQKEKNQLEIDVSSATMDGMVLRKLRDALEQSLERLNEESRGHEFENTALKKELEIIKKEQISLQQQVSTFEESHSELMEQIECATVVLSKGQGQVDFWQNWKKRSQQRGQSDSMSV